MKTKWEIPAVLTPALVAYDNTQLINACQATLNSAKGKLKTEASMSDVKTVAKGVEFTFNEKGEVVTYTGNANHVSRFVAESDSLRTHYKRHGAPVKPLTADVFSKETRDWLDDKFTLGKAAKVVKANGPVRGGIKSVVPA